MATITLTVPPIDAAGPRVQVDVDDIPTGYRLTLHRIFDGVATMVRDARDAFASGGFSVIDYEVPGGVAVSYRAELFDETGASQGFTDAAETELSWPMHIAYISDPLDPGNIVAAEMHTNFASVVSRPREVALMNVGTRVISLLGVTGRIRGVPLWCNTYTKTEADTLARVIAATNVLVRTCPPVRVPRAMYVAIPDPEENEQTVQLGFGQIRWELVGDEISSPDLNIVVPVVTWQTYIDAFPTWEDFNNAYLTWNDAIRNPPEV